MLRNFNFRNPTQQFMADGCLIPLLDFLFGLSDQSLQWFLVKGYSCLFATLWLTLSFSGANCIFHFTNLQSWNCNTPYIQATRRITWISALTIAVTVVGICIDSGRIGCLVCEVPHTSWSGKSIQMFSRAVMFGKKSDFRTKSVEIMAGC